MKPAPATTLAVLARHDVELGWTRVGWTRVGGGPETAGPVRPVI